MSVLTFYLSAEEYGLIQLSNSFIRLFEILISFGTLQFLLTKFYDLSQQEKLKISFNSFIYYSFFLIILYVLVILILNFNSKTVFDIPIFYFCIIPFISYVSILYETLCSILIYKEHAKKYNYLTLSKLFFEIILIYFCIILFDFGWFARILAMLFSALVSILIFAKYIKNSNFFSKKVEFKSYLYNTKKGFPLVLLSISILVFDLSDRFFIERMLGLKETGLYSVSYTYSSIVLIIGNTIFNAIRPRIYQNLTDKNNSIMRLFLLQSSLILILALAIFIAKDFVFDTFFDEKYMASKSFTNSLVLGFVVWNFYFFFNSILIFYNKNYLVSIISFFGIIVNLLLNYYFINIFGAVGASYATLVSCIIMLALSLIFSLKFLNYKN